MAKGTLLGLVALFALLAFLWLQKEKEVARGGPELAEYPLCPDLSSERVRALRVDHLERGLQLKFERDAAGRWFMTDPLAYPAQSALVRMLLQSLESARGAPAPEVELEEVGLEPPLVVLELIQVEDVGERTLRVELGALDHDPALVYARVPGHPNATAGGSDVFRTTRSLTTTLDRNPDDYRERRATGLGAEDVISIRRQGQVQRVADGALEDLAFDALDTPDGWKRATPPAVSLDPSAVGLLVRGACELSAQRFVDDSPRDLARWGLAAPAFTLELEALASGPVVLEFGSPELVEPRPLSEVVWFCQRRGFAHVWEVRARDIELLASPASLFFDQLVVRALRSDVTRLELEGGGARRVLTRERKDWRVHEVAASETVPAGAAEVGPSQPGNPAAIEEALALLEKVQLAEHLPGELFEPSNPPLGFTLVLKDGTLQGGALGRPTRDPASGAQGLQFLRLGDEVVALIDASVSALCLRPLDAFRSRKLHQIQESEVRALELEHAGKTYVFVNTGDNVWQPKGQSIQAPPDFVQSLDGLLNLGAVRWLDAAPPHEIVLAVLVRPTQGDPYRFIFARAREGTTLCLVGSELVAEVDAALVERLLELF
ncbi:MAG: DUF4340 domain-containing protein [Planctomycetes bacterium]|nr:DUF4340 domain-containing protein [Planctomycetota bacterium]